MEDIKLLPQGTTKHSTPIQAIRKKCIDCSGGSTKEVRLCPCKDCDLYPFRMGTNPFHKLSKQKYLVDEEVS